MDPVSLGWSVGSLGVAVIRISAELYKFLEASKNVKGAVADLSDEINNLARSLTAVEKGLQSPALLEAERTVHATNDSQELWICVHGSVSDCQKTVESLDKYVSTLTGNSSQNRSPTFARRALLQLQLNLKEDEISSLRAQIASHCIALQTTLQVVNLRASYIGPKIVAADLAPKLCNLQDQIGRLEDFLSRNANNKRASNATGVVSDLQSLKNLNKTAQRVFSSASTVYTTSEWEGSLQGDFFSEERRIRTMEWISSDPITEEFPASSSSLTQALSEEQDIESADRSQAALLAYGFDIEDVRCDINQALFWVLNQSKEQDDLVQFLLLRGANTKSAPFQKCAASYLAACHDHPTVLRRLLLNGAPSDARYGPRTALNVAASRGFSNVVRILLDFGANSNAKDEFGWNALQLAVFEGYEKVVETLLRGGADVNTRVLNELQSTPLHIASQRPQSSIVNLLLRYSPDLNARDNSSWAPLHYAAQKGDSSTISSLLQSDEIEIEAKTSEGFTPIAYAVLFKRREAASQLLTKGATVQIRFNANQMNRFKEQGHQSVQHPTPPTNLLEAIRGWDVTLYEQAKRKRSGSRLSFF